MHTDQLPRRIVSAMDELDDVAACERCGEMFNLYSERAEVADVDADSSLVVHVECMLEGEVIA
jgi:hypothetical protein